MMCLLRGVGGDGLLPPRCYQNTRHKDDLGRHPAIRDRFGQVSLGSFGCPEYVVRDNLGLPRFGGE